MTKVRLGISLRYALAYSSLLFIFTRRPIHSILLVRQNEPGICKKALLQQLPWYSAARESFE